TDFSAGPLKRTGNKAHVGIPGDGFFVVQKGEETFLTRAGNFTVANGRLVTQQGFDVLSDIGSPIAIDPSDPSWHITDAGIVEQAAGRQSLALVMPESLGDLVTLGENLFKSFSEPVPLPPGDRRVIPQHIEGSSVSPTTEMTEMIKTARAMEANVNLIKFQDQMLSGLVNRVLKV
ncbi:MAG: flagellar basal body rod C-terminal domain-containing protein, partial [Thermoguttaceae bacterium]